MNRKTPSHNETESQRDLSPAPPSRRPNEMKTSISGRTSGRGRASFIHSLFSPSFMMRKWLPKQRITKQLHFFFKNRNVLIECHSRVVWNVSLQGESRLLSTLRPAPLDRLHDGVSRAQSQERVGVGPWFFWVGSQNTHGSPQDRSLEWEKWYARSEYQKKDRPTFFNFLTPKWNLFIF